MCNRLYQIIIITLLLAGCQSEPQETPKDYSQIEDLKSAPFHHIINDGETWDIASNYNFRISESIFVNHLDQGHFKITNMIPMEMENVYITMNIYKTQIILGRIKNLPGLSETVVEYPMADGKRKFYNLDFKVVTLPDNFKMTSHENQSFYNFSFIGEPDNEKMNILKNITCDWRINLHRKFGKTIELAEENGVCSARPVQFRLWLSAIMNTAYIFSQQEFEDILKKQRYYYCTDGNPVYDKDQAENAYVYKGSGFTWGTKYMGTTYQDDHEAVDAVLKNLRNDFHLDLGIARGGASYGGGAGKGGPLSLWANSIRRFHRCEFVGVPYETLKYGDKILNEDVYFLPDYYYEKGPMALFAHEIGHCLGFGHNSNWCSTGRVQPVGTKYDAKPGRYGFPAAANYVANKLISTQKLFINKKDYFRQKDYDYDLKSLPDGSDYTTVPTYIDGLYENMK
ncbi:hypothetical protein K5X82_05105 [Halosquirtibacter xylanolyticus]|uniref:hypothetical protein n=1 Tax=Halosquirtibacter xylanolyticus TaxID=3374599 RepID=UPI00374A42C4|nr:hypothetical protein K5X82_05105 [Prolixibacteraceae bacterium]